MKKKTSLSEEDQALFRQLMTGTRKIKQDTIVHRPQRKKITEVAPKRLLQEQVDNSHYFSDEFQPLLNTEGSTKYVRPDVSHFELKKLRRGDYSPGVATAGAAVTAGSGGPSDGVGHLEVAGAFLPEELTFAVGIQRHAGDSRGGEHRGRFPRTQL